MKPAEEVETEEYTKAGKEESRHDEDFRVYHDGASAPGSSYSQCIMGRMLDAQ